MIAGLAARDTAASGLRPFDPLRDLRPAAELIELAFGDALDSAGRQMLREMRTLSSVLGPLFWLVGASGSPLADFYSGYVWLEEGEIVGNVTVHRHYRGRRGWFISNLAVHPQFRRKGIATRLVKAGIDFARAKDARRISLEVKAENRPARRLYSGLGFTEIDSVTKMRMSRPPTATPLTLQKAQIKLLQRAEGQELFRLAQEALSPEAQEILPLRESDHRQSALRRLITGLGDLLKGRLAFRFAAYSQGRLAGLLTLRTGAFLAVHSLSLMVHPDHRGEVEESLLTHALCTLEGRRWQPLVAEIHPSYRLAIEAFDQYGFAESETMQLLTLSLRQ